MKIVSSDGMEISSLEDWAKLHSDIHWKEGRSAYSVADFVLNRGGAAHLESRLSKAFGAAVSICRVTPEKQIRFDAYGRGRFHDLAIECVVRSGKTLFVGLEAKVDESFGRTIQDEVEDAKKYLDSNPRSKKLERIKALPARYSPNLGINSMLDIHYQLVHGTAGTVSALQENQKPYDLYVFYVLVFKTSLYDQQVGKGNHQDYLRFVSRVAGSEIEHSDVEAHSLTMDNKPLTCIYEHLEMPRRS